MQVLIISNAQDIDELQWKEFIKKRPNDFRDILIIGNIDKERLRELKKNYRSKLVLKVGGFVDDKNPEERECITLCNISDKVMNLTNQNKVTRETQNNRIKWLQHFLVKNCTTIGETEEKQYYIEKEKTIIVPAHENRISFEENCFKLNIFGGVIYDLESGQVKQEICI